MNKFDPSAREDDPTRPKQHKAEEQPVDEESTGLSSLANQSAVFRFVGLGTELAGFTLVFAGLGYLVDRFSQDAKPYGTALGALIGFTLGMVRFIQQARKSDDP